MINDESILYTDYKFNTTESLIYSNNDMMSEKINDIKVEMDCAIHSIVERINQMEENMESKIDYSKILNLYKNLRMEEIEENFNQDVQEIKEGIKIYDQIDKLKEHFKQEVLDTLKELPKELYSYRETRDSETDEMVAAIEVFIQGLNLVDVKDTEAYKEAQNDKFFAQEELADLLARVSAVLATCDSRYDVNEVLMDYGIIDGNNQILA